MVIRLESARDKILSVFVMLFFVLTMLPSYENSADMSLYTYIGFFISAISCTLALLWHKEKWHFIKTEISLYCFIEVLYCLSILVNGNSQISYLIWNSKYFFIAMVLFRINIWLFPVRVSFWGLILFFIQQIIMGTNIRDITFGVSRNVISIHLLIVSIIYVLALNKKKLSHRGWIPIAVSCLVTVWTGSRSGMLSFFVLLVGVIFWGKMDNNGSKRLKRQNKMHSILIFGVCALGVSVIFNYLSNTGRINYFLSMFNEKRNLNILEDVRFDVIGDYLLKSVSSPISLLFGAKFSSIQSIYSLENNLHNSYLFAYGNYGLVFFLLIIINIIRSMIYFSKEKNISLIFLLSICIRIFSDIAAFYGILDPLLYFFIFEVVLLKKQMRIKIV